MADSKLMATPRRLVFGAVAELYDASRPTYPEPLIDDVLELAHAGAGVPILEVGAGTGKATVLFAARGARVLAIEPSPQMAAVARRNCADYPEVEIIESDFEHWDAAGRKFPLLYSAQAWHWIDPERRFVYARAALRPSGLLAAFWNRPAWGESPIRDALRAVYREVVPDLEPVGPLHPANVSSLDRDDWEADVVTAAGFDGQEVRRYDWRIDYSADEFARLLATLSEIRLLDEPTREALLAGIRRAIVEHGGELAMPMLTKLCLARAV
jgi:SAM-dependent methyltransferase